MKGPIIKLNETEITTTKDIEIKFPVEHRGEYSLDLGQTWKEYTGFITINEPTTILARTVDKDGNILSSSSFKVTKIHTDVSGTELTGFAKAIYNDNPLVVKEPTLDDSINNTANQAGLYKSFKTNSGNPTYYSRGNVENNYVTFAEQT